MVKKMKNATFSIRKIIVVLSVWISNFSTVRVYYTVVILWYIFIWALEAIIFYFWVQLFILKCGDYKFKSVNFTGNLFWKRVSFQWVHFNYYVYFISSMKDQIYKLLNTSSVILLKAKLIKKLQNVEKNWI